MITGGKCTGGKMVALQGGDRIPSLVNASVCVGHGLVHLVERTVPFGTLCLVANLIQTFVVRVSTLLSCDLFKQILRRWEALLLAGLCLTVCPSLRQYKAGLIHQCGVCSSSSSRTPPLTLFYLHTCLDNFTQSI